MKKIMILVLAVMLAACSSAPAAVATEPPAPTEILPTQTPIVVVQTVVVESTPVPVEVQPTQVPPTAPPVIVNVVVPTTAPVDTGSTTTTNASPDPNAPIALENALGAGVFINLTVSDDALTLRCFPRELTFTATAVDPVTVTDAVFYYRTVDLQRLYPSEWVSGGEMESDGNGNFSLVFNGEDVNPNLRLDGAYLDFQIVGLNRGGGRVDASEKIEGLIKYTFDCP